MGAICLCCRRRLEKQGIDDKKTMDPVEAVGECPKSSLNPPKTISHVVVYREIALNGYLGTRARLCVSKPRFHLLGWRYGVGRTCIEHALLPPCVCAASHVPAIFFARREARRGTDGGCGAVERGERLTFEMSTSKSRGDTATGEAGENADDLCFASSASGGPGKRGCGREYDEGWTIANPRLLGIPILLVVSPFRRCCPLPNRAR